MMNFLFMVFSCEISFSCPWSGQGLFQLLLGGVDIPPSQDFYRKNPA